MFRFFNKTYLRRTIVLTLLMVFISNIIMPTISWALTSGPTAPEATSFEPVDTTDMVNLATGDFTYNMPLLEVPGPAGGYPLSLSYHAGIQTNEEASWVGLGWTLNPGAITRNVLGYPDDHKDVSNVARTFWEGGEKKTQTYGLSYGITKAATVSAGLSFSQDTYQGKGVGGYVGASIGIETNSPMNANVGVKVGVRPYGGTYASASVNTNLGVGKSLGNNIQAVAGVGAGANFSTDGNNSGGVGLSASVNKSYSKGQQFEFLGASISSGGGGGNVSVGGSSSNIHNSKSGNVSTSTSGITLDIPIIIVPGLNIRLGFNTTRYWIDEAETKLTSGSLFYPEQYLDAADFDNLAFDTYDLENTEEYTNQTEKIEHDAQVLGGSFPSYDKYNVTAQGVFGSIRPYHLKKQLTRQNIKQGDRYKVMSLSQYVPEKNYDHVYSNEKVGFRFENDFSNKFTYEFDGEFKNNSNDEDYWIVPAYDFTSTSNETHGINDNNGKSNYKLFGSKNIEWFTNEEVNSTTARNSGLRLPEATGFWRSHEGSLKDQIGAFMVTNNSGVTYHYALPAYSKNEHMRSTNYGETEEREGFTGNYLSKPEPYAYTWFLTSLTGPDYYDTNDNGRADEGDWGYWVNFEYGQWTDSYQWRNPGQGYNYDLDGKFRNYAYGQKEIYYLNFIRTQTHTAAFVKDIRADAKAVLSGYSGDTYKQINTQSNCIDRCDNICDRDSYEYECERCIEACDSQPTVDYYELSEPQMRLDHILLYKNGQAESELGSQGNGGIQYTEYYNGTNVLDVKDDMGYESIDILRKIQLNHDYSLAQGTPNSYDADGSNYHNAPDFLNHPWDFSALGKLTLNSIEFFGENGASSDVPLPPTQFDYAKNPDFAYQAFDAWGYYKNDWDQNVIDNNPNLGRYTTDNSSNDVDAWSLTDISTPTGSNLNIHYESDSYDKVALNSRSLFKVIQLNDIESSSNQFRIQVQSYGTDLSPYLTSGNILELDFFVGHDEISPDDCSNYTNHAVLPSSDKVSGKAEISSFFIVSAASFNTYVITLNSTDLKNRLLNYNGRVSIVGYCGNDPSENTYNISKVKIGWPDILYGGLLNLKKTDIKGGGIRVARISTENRYIQYNYSGGVTPYEPWVIPTFSLNDIDSENILQYSLDEVKAKLNETVLSKYHNIISNSRELPAPGATYSEVTVTSGISKTSSGSDISTPGKTKYRFQTYDKDFVSTEYGRVSSIPTEYDPGILYLFGPSTKQGAFLDDFRSREMEVIDFSNRLGLLKSVEEFDELDKKLSGTYYNFLYNESIDIDSYFFDDLNYKRKLYEQFNNQGLIQEAFSDVRLVPQYYGDETEAHVLAMLSKRSKYPVVPTSTTQVDYEKGITQKSYNLAFDFYSGEVTKTMNDDGRGNYFVSEQIPAYKKYPAMGLKGESIDNHNMLTQIAGTFTYQVEPSDDPYDLNAYTKQALVGATASIWNSGNLLGTGYLKQSEYKYIGASRNDDGYYPLLSTSDNFDWDNSSSFNIPNSWEKKIEITQYDNNSHPIEVKDKNDIYSSSIYDFADEKIIASASNVRNANFRYQGFEGVFYDEYYDGGFSYYGAVSTQAHTGTAGMLLNNNESINTLFGYSLPEKFRVSFWVHSDGINNVFINFMDENDNIVEFSKSDFEVGQNGNWVLCDMIIDKPELDLFDLAIVAKGGSVIIDDVLIKPVAASSSAYVYNNWDELTHIINNDNLYTRFEYDAMGRLRATYKETLQYGEVKVSEHKINYRANAY